MAELISIETARKSKDRPDSNCISADAEGHPLFLFSLGYHHDGRRFCVDIWARSKEDAADQVAAMRKTLWLEGKVLTSEPV